MVELIKEAEAIPATYRSITPRWLGGVDQADAMFDEHFHRDPGSDQVWQRIESYIRTRYTTREVIWIIEGGEDEVWVPPLSPINSMIVEKWESGAWASVTLPEGPVGYCLTSDGTFRITAQVGGGSVPPAVEEAWKRLHEYSRGIAESVKTEAATFESNSDGGGRAVSAWAAKALQLSGAADLLRPYRRQK